MSSPNVLIIYPDQMRFDGMGCSGNPLINTPNHDRHACEDVRFYHAYTSFHICYPFRDSVMTGIYSRFNDIFANHYSISPEQNNLDTHADYTSILNELGAILTNHKHRTQNNWFIEAIFPPPNFLTHEECAESFKKLIKETIVED